MRDLRDPPQAVTRRQARLGHAQEAKAEGVPGDCRSWPTILSAAPQRGSRLRPWRTLNLTKKWLRIVPFVSQGRSARRTPSTAPWQSRLAKAEASIEALHRFTACRYMFTDLVRLANVDAVVRRALTGSRHRGDAAALFSTVEVSMKNARRFGACCASFHRAPTTQPASTTGKVFGWSSEVVLKIASLRGAEGRCSSPAFLS